jgi:PKD repeat protein
MRGISLTLVSVAVALAGAGCTVHQTEAPALTGPSEYALSVSVSASPDSISQDGRSNSTISVVARDASGRSVANAPFRLDILADGQAADYGTLSTRNVVTASDGKASAVYTAPPAQPNGAVVGVCAGNTASAPLAGRCVDIVATAVGSDYSASGSRSVQIHLIPTGTIVPGGATPVASFTASPSSPAANVPVVFDATKSCGGSTDSAGNCPSTAGRIVSYAWNFGDGTTASGSTSSHTYARQQSYLVTLTVTNDQGYSASSTQTLNVGAGAVPTPAFTSSPATPAPGQAVQFDATTSKPGAGHQLVRYVWNWGDGSAFGDSSSPSVSHTFASAGAYVVTLTVADDVGQTASVFQTITVGAGTAPTSTFSYSPTSVNPGQTINFNATQSVATGAGRSITQYRWNWGDGTAQTTSSSPLATHAFSLSGSYVVTLTVTDDVGQTANSTQTIRVGTPPTARFVFSPTNPGPGQSINFDASQSTADPGHSVVQYQWNWGDGTALTTSNSALASHTFAAEANYVVVLTVTDDQGQKGVTTVTVTVKAP